MHRKDVFIATRAADVLAPATDVDLVLYSVLWRDLCGQPAQSPTERAAVASRLDAFRGRYGRLWVGGALGLTDEALVFVPDAPRRPAPADTDAFRLPLADILDVALERHLLRGVIVVNTKRGRLRLRCFNAGRFMSLLASACAATLTGAPPSRLDPLTA